MPVVSFTRTVYYTRTSTRTLGRASTFTGFSRTANFIRFSAGIPSTRVIVSSRFNYYGGEPATGNFTTDYTSYFVGDFTRNRLSTYTRTRPSSYTGYYSRQFLGYYSRSYEGIYARSSAGIYSRNFVRSYSRNFVRSYARGYSGTYTRFSSQDFSRNYTRSSVGTYSRVSTYTRTISGGSGETPVYTAPASDAEYGLVVYGPDGVTEIINPTTRVINLAFYGTVSVAPYSSATVTIPDVGDPSKVSVSFLVRYYDISMTVSGNTLTVINNRSTASSPAIIAIRI